jgi:mRNA interferase MazF
VRRGDLVTVALQGDLSKPRPALVIQSNALAETDSVLVCPLTTTQRAAPLYRLTLPANTQTGLLAPSQVMVDKITAVRRTLCGPPIGHADPATMLALGRLLTFMIGVAD